jgi:hypothetical protein
MNAAVLAALFAVPLLFASCAPQTCWKGGEPMRETERKAQWGAEVDILKSARDVVIYRGLAHPAAESARYEQQVRKGGWVEFEDFKFHAEPAEFKAGTADKVLALYNRSASHEALVTKTTCDGFHPDYALVWSQDGHQRVLQICHGCHEWKFHGPGGTVHTDIEDDTYFKELRPLLPKNRID